MSLENLTAARSIYGRWANGEITPTLERLIDPRVEVHPDRQSAWPGIEPAWSRG